MLSFRELVYAVGLYLICPPLLAVDLKAEVASAAVPSTNTLADCKKIPSTPITPKERNVSDASRARCSETVACNCNLAFDTGQQAGKQYGDGEGLRLSKDSLTTLQALMQGIGLFFAVLALVFGAIVGVNVYQGASVLKDAREELKSVQLELVELKTARSQYASALDGMKMDAEKIKADTTSALRLESEATIERISRQAYRGSILQKYVREVLEELDRPNPDEGVLYPKITALFGYRDEDIRAVYEKCLRVLPPNSDSFLAIVSHGLKDFLDAGSRATR